MSQSSQDTGVPFPDQGLNTPLSRPGRVTFYVRVLKLSVVGVVDVGTVKTVGMEARPLRRSARKEEHGQLEMLSLFLSRKGCQEKVV